MQRESEPTPFRPSKGQPVLRLDARGRAAAAKALKHPLSDNDATFNVELANLSPRNEPNIIIDRTGSTPHAA